MTAMLKVEGVNQYYGGSHILRNLSFEAKAGEVTVILGRNGVGKTTLLKSLMGVVPIRTGTIALQGQPLNKDTPYERVRKGVGYVPQGREIFGRLTVDENLRMGLATKPGGTSILSFGALRLDRTRRMASLEGRDLMLAPREWDLLCFFAEHPGQAFSRSELLDRVWGYGHDGYNHTVNSHINRLRAKLGDDRNEPRYLHTVWGVGYRFEPNDAG